MATWSKTLFCERVRKKFSFQESGFAKGILGDREEVAGDETGKVNYTYIERHFVGPNGQFASYIFPWGRK